MNDAASNRIAARGKFALLHHESFAGPLIPALNLLIPSKVDSVSNLRVFKLVMHTERITFVRSKVIDWLCKNMEWVLVVAHGSTTSPKSRALDCTSDTIRSGLISASAPQYPLVFVGQ